MLSKPQAIWSGGGRVCNQASKDTQGSVTTIKSPVVTVVGADVVAVADDAGFGPAGPVLLPLPPPPAPVVSAG